jgi:hypothetical protein
MASVSSSHAVARGSLNLDSHVTFLPRATATPRASRGRSGGRSCSANRTLGSFPTDDDSTDTKAYETWA